MLEGPPTNESLAGFGPWLYLALFLAPFFQEDAAIVGAAGAAASAQGYPAAIFIAALLGLSFSDVWKYWVGRLAHRWPWASRIAGNARVAAAADRVSRRLGVALIIARFVPGTRIPLYVACGYFRVPSGAL